MTTNIFRGTKMKQIFFLLLLFTGYALAQEEIIINDTTSGGVYTPNTQKYLGTKNTTTHSRMPVDIGSAPITITIGATSNNYGTSFTTTGTTIDSVSFGFTTQSVTFINDGISTDTLFISPVKTFPSTNRIKRMGGEGLTKQWAVSKLYFKVGTTPLASKKIRIEAQ
jgi:hypothetical protein